MTTIEGEDKIFLELEQGVLQRLDKEEGPISVEVEDLPGLMKNQTINQLVNKSFFYIPSLSFVLNNN